MARTRALQALFAVDLGGMNPDSAVENLVDGEKRLTPGDISFLRSLVLGTASSLECIDVLIKENAVGWRLERMAVVDRNILRMALYEMLNYNDTPVNVIINEAVELAKKFGEEESGKFVNGVLDNASKTIRRE